MSVTALVLGILSLPALCFWFFALPLSIAAIICGVMARNRQKALGRPTGMAMAGLIMGIISTVIAVALVVLVVIIGVTAPGGTYYG